MASTSWPRGREEREDAEGTEEKELSRCFRLKAQSTVARAAAQPRPSTCSPSVIFDSFAS